MGNSADLGPWPNAKDDADGKRALGVAKEMVRRDQVALFVTGTGNPPAISHARRKEKELRAGPEGAAGRQGDHA